MLATLVRIVHVLIVVAALVGPFVNDDALLTTYVFVIPFMWLHWLMNDDTCALTALERKLRGLESDSDSFIYSIVSPVYKIQNETVQSIAWGVSVLLWGVAVYRARQRGSISKAFKSVWGCGGGGGNSDITSLPV